MDIGQTDKLILFLILFIPGFISIKIYDLMVPGERRDFSSSVFEAIAYSAFNFAALSWLIIIIHSGDFPDSHKIMYIVFLFLIIFIVPIIWPILLFKLLTSAFLGKYVIHPIQKPWDFVFGKGESSWVIVHLKNGEKIGGRFEDESFASSSPAEEQIYIEEVWELDENAKFIRPLARSKGMIILKDEILGVEFFE
jgi:hypothetical protein